jgi:hypothetical protein
MLFRDTLCVQSGAAKRYLGLVNAPNQQALPGSSWLTIYKVNLVHFSFLFGDLEPRLTQGRTVRAGIGARGVIRAVIARETVSE